MENFTTIDLSLKFWSIFLALIFGVCILGFGFHKYNLNRQSDKYTIAKDTIEKSAYIDDLKKQILAYQQINKQLIKAYNEPYIDPSLPGTVVYPTDETNNLENQLNKINQEIEVLKDKITQETKVKGATVEYASVIIYNGEFYCQIIPERIYGPYEENDCLVGTSKAPMNFKTQDAIKTIYNGGEINEKAIYTKLNEDDKSRIAGVANLGELELMSANKEELYIRFDL